MKDIEERYRLHRLKRPDAAPWDKVIHYALNGNEFGRPLKNVDWEEVMKINKNTVPRWMPLVMDYIVNSSILNEKMADVIVSLNKTKQKGLK